MNVWRFIDPLLLRVRSRLEHLADFTPSRGFEGRLRREATLGKGVILFDSTALSSSSRPEDMVIGDYACVRGEIMLIRVGARFSMGHHSFLGRGSQIWAQTEITVGNFVLISHYVDIIDSNSHSLDYRHRRADAINLFEKGLPIDMTPIESAPIRIEDDVWIGAKSTILKGVHIGRGAVVAAGSVVTKDVPPFTLVAGNPARALRKLAEESE